MVRRAAVAPCWLLAVAVAWAPQVRAEIFNFDQVPVPGPHTLQTHYMFYVKAESTSPATASFKNLVMTPAAQKAPAEADLAAYQSLQVSIMPIKDFWKYVDTQKFCSDEHDVASKAAPAAKQLLLKVQDPPDVAMHTVTPEISKAETQLTTSGTYVLVFSNCGDLEGLSVAGTVEVQNPWGFLPATEYNKKSLYGFLALFYSFTATAWSLMALRWWKQLLYIQKGIMALNFICVLEAWAWYALYMVWNSNGDYSMVMFLVAGLAACWKMIISFRIFLLSSEDEQQDRDESRGSSIQVHLALMLYMVLDFNMKTVMAFRNSRALNITFILLNSMPAILMGVVMFIWVHMSIMKMIEKLRARSQEDKASFFQKLQGVMVLAVLLAGFTVVVQIFDPTVHDESLWGYHFLAADGMGQLAFALMLCLAMAVALPREDLQGYEYSVQAQTDGTIVGAPGSVWDDDDCEAR